MSNVRDDQVAVAELGQQPLFGSIPREDAAAAQNLPYIRRDKDGRPIVVMESMIPIDVRRREEPASASSFRSSGPAPTSSSISRICDSLPAACFVPACTSSW